MLQPVVGSKIGRFWKRTGTNAWELLPFSFPTGNPNETKYRISPKFNDPNNVIIGDPNGDFFTGESSPIAYRSTDGVITANTTGNFDDYRALNTYSGYDDKYYAPSAEELPFGSTEGVYQTEDLTSWIPVHSVLPGANATVVHHPGMGISTLRIWWLETTGINNYFGLSSCAVNNTDVIWFARSCKYDGSDLQSSPIASQWWKDGNPNTGLIENASAIGASIFADVALVINTAGVLVFDRDSFICSGSGITAPSTASLAIIQADGTVSYVFPSEWTKVGSAILPLSNTRFVCLRVGGATNREISIWLSTDGGYSWTATYTNTLLQATSSHQDIIAYDPTDANRLCVIFPEQLPIVLISEDGGATWTEEVIMDATPEDDRWEAVAFVGGITVARRLFPIVTLVGAT